MYKCRICSQIKYIVLWLWVENKQTTRKSYVLLHEHTLRDVYMDQEAVDATSINTFKSKLDKLRHTRMGFFMA